MVSLREHLLDRIAGVGVADDPGDRPEDGPVDRDEDDDAHEDDRDLTGPSCSRTCSIISRRRESGNMPWFPVPCERLAELTV